MKAFEQRCGMRRRAWSAAAVMVSFVTSPGLAQAPAGSGLWFLQNLKTVVDAGDLLRPDRVANSLSLHLEEVTQEDAAPTQTCKQPGDFLSSVRITHSTTPPWLRPTQEGMQNMPVPSFFINPPFVSGKPQLSYYEFRSSYCGGGYMLRKETGATIFINGLPSFACFDRNTLAQFFHREVVIATDGFEFIDYPGFVDDQSGARLEVTFRAFAPCALSLTIEQKVEYGYRYQRAAAATFACTSIEIRRFCAANGPFPWGDDKVTLMNEAAKTACGGLSDFYDKEPLTGQPPAVVTQKLVLKSGPCDPD